MFASSELGTLLLSWGAILMIGRSMSINSEYQKGLAFVTIEE
jgi:hypothetical protein